jgi:hypothetical protein
MSNIIQGVQNLYERLDRMALISPQWIDITWGAGGSTADLTTELCVNAQKYVGLEVMMHLTCTNMPRERVDLALKQAKEAGIQNILALRGGDDDPPIALPSSRVHVETFNFPSFSLFSVFRVLRGANVRNADPPAGQEQWERTEGGFDNAVDLVKVCSCACQKRKLAQYFFPG